MAAKAELLTAHLINRIDLTARRRVASTIRGQITLSTSRSRATSAHCAGRSSFLRAVEYVEAMAMSAHPCDAERYFDDGCLATS